MVIYEGGEPYYNPTSTPMDTKHFARQFNMTNEQVVIGLFRINGGQPGYYLANLCNRKYYYYGNESNDIRHTLRSQGIGRPDPTEEL